MTGRVLESMCSGMERSGNFGWPAAIYLLQRDVSVVEVPPLMTSRERLSRPGQGKPTQWTQSRSPASLPERMPCHQSDR
jgi:hypothetical protein